MPKAYGTATISNKKGSVQIDAKSDELSPARNFGAEYMTYVLWAVTSEGRTNNVGELLLDSGGARLKASTKFQSFGLFVTAEPYFAVSASSTNLVLEKVFPARTRFPVEEPSRFAMT
jgi:hypothetical protein